MATDNFEAQVRSMLGPIEGGFAVTPHDTNELTRVVRGLYIGGFGDVKVTFKGGDTVTFYSVQAGTLLPVRAVKVLATGTSATNIVGVD